MGFSLLLEENQVPSAGLQFFHNLALGHLPHFTFSLTCISNLSPTFQQPVPPGAFAIGRPSPRSDPPLLPVLVTQSIFHYPDTFPPHPALLGDLEMTFLPVPEHPAFLSPKAFISITVDLLIICYVQ